MTEITPNVKKGTNNEKTREKLRIKVEKLHECAKDVAMVMAQQTNP